MLRNYCTLEVPAAGWEIVIVDNGSSDHTKQVVHAFGARLPVTYCYEPIPGKNTALNRGLSHVTGNLIVFTDDDIFPKRDWLIQLCNAADAHESYTVFGGVIVPRWELEPPWPIYEAVPLSICFAIHAPGVHEGPCIPDRAFGGNVAIRATAFRAGDRFDPTLGPRPIPSPMGSETELLRRLARQGHKVWFCPRAIVEHFVPRSHMETSWILKRAERWGRTTVRLEGPELGPLWMGIPRWVFRSLGESMRDIMLGSIAGNAAKVLKARWNLHELMGMAAEVRSTSKQTALRSTPFGRASGSNA